VAHGGPIRLAGLAEGAKQVGVRRGHQVLGTASVENGRWSATVPSEAVGIGEASVVVRAVYPDGRGVRSEPLALRVREPALVASVAVDGPLSEGLRAVVRGKSGESRELAVAQLNGVLKEIVKDKPARGEKERPKGGGKGQSEEAGKKPSERGGKDRLKGGGKDPAIGAGKGGAEGGWKDPSMGPGKDDAGPSGKDRSRGARKDPSKDGGEGESVTLTGLLKIEKAGFHQLAIASDGGVKLSVHGRVVADATLAGGGPEAFVPLGLEAGWHPIEIELRPAGKRPFLKVVMAGEQVPDVLGKGNLAH
jgi:hypothetical protein